MSQRMKLMCAALTAAFFGATAAVAAPVTTFDYQGTATAGTTVLNVGPGFPAGGVQTIDDGTDQPSSFAILAGDGSVDPLSYGAGATAAGQATASVNYLVTVVIENDAAVAREAFLNALIFGGGVGVALPDFDQPGCDFGDLANCTDFAANDPSLLPEERASLDFSLTANGNSVFDGSIDVDSTGASSTFNDIALNNFGASAGNPDFLTWEDTAIQNQSLGMIEAGGTLTLEFLVQISVSSSGQTGCFDSTFECRLSMAGFGDPEEEGGILYLFSQQQLFLTADFGAPEEVPLPPAAFLFLAGAGALRLRGLRR